MGNFVYGLIVGVVIGAVMAFVIMSLISAGKNDDLRKIRGGGYNPDRIGKADTFGASDNESGVRWVDSVAKSNVLPLIILFAIAAFIILLIIVRIVLKIEDLAAELDYIEREIKRSAGSERKRWKRKRRRLLFSFIFPFM